MGLLETYSQPKVVSTFASPHEPALNGEALMNTFENKIEVVSKPKACKRASAFPAHVTAFQDGFGIAHAQKNKINLCFVDRLVQIDKDNKMIAK